MKTLILTLVVAFALTQTRADEGADVPLRPFKICAQQFLEAVAAENYDRAFEMLDRGDIRVGVLLKKGDEATLLAKKKQRFLDEAKAFTGFASWVITSQNDLLAVRHDGMNVSVWVPLKEGRIVVDLRELVNGQIVIGSFAIRDDSIPKGPRLP
ncbi:MAG TPA: hypothetical protein VGM54_11105 [Chthoniobacter sp.]|jgi:hypothetical protein